MVEVSEPVPQGLLEEQQNPVSDEGKDVVAQQPVREDLPQLIKVLPGALSDGGHQLVARHYLLRELGGVLGRTRPPSFSGPEPSVRSSARHSSGNDLMIMK